MNKALNISTRIIFYMIIMAAPIQWVNIITVGSLSMKFIDIAVLPVFLCLLFKQFRIHLIEFIVSYKLIVISFLLLMTANYVSTVFSGVNLDVGFGYIAKNTFYMFCFTLFGAIIGMRAERPNFYKEVALSNTFCIGFFLVVVTIVFQAMGRNFLAEILAAFFKGDSKAIRYDLFLKLFNSSGGDEEIRTSLRNTLVGAFIYVHFTSLYSLANCKQFLLKSLNIFNMLFTLFIILASTSRSNMVVLALGYLCVVTFSFVTGKIKFKPIYFILICSLLFVGVLFFEKIQNMFGSSAEMIGGRLEQLQGDARWDLNAEAIAIFAENFFSGKGSGVVLTAGLRPHNFILGSAVQAGITGIILALLFYFGIIGFLINSIRPFYSSKGLYWVSAVVMLPLLRAMTSGNSGTLSIIEWFTLAFFFVVLKVSRQSQPNKAYASAQKIRPLMLTN